MAVKNVLRVAGALVAVGLVGYAVTVASRPDPEQGAAKPAAARKTPASGRGSRGKAPPSPEVEARRAAVAAKQAAAPPPPPVPSPPVVDYAKAYEDLEVFVVDLESLKRRGKSLPQPEWVEKYRRGNELIDVLMRAPEFKQDDKQREILALNMRFREVIHEVLAKPPG